MESATSVDDVYIQVLELKAPSRKPASQITLFE
jgi:hypothetical protein